MTSPAIPPFRPLTWRDPNGNKLIPCPWCKLPVGRVVNGVLHFSTRHNGERHEVAIDLQTLQKWLTDDVKRVLDSATTAHDHR